MQRKRQQLLEQECIDILNHATLGTLALLGDGDYLYSLSLVSSMLMTKSSSTQLGHKIDAIRGCDKASFYAIQKDDVKPKEYATYFRSVICFGHIHILDNDEDKMKTARMLGNRYNPNDKEALAAEIRKDLKAMCMIELNIEHMTG